MKRFVGLVLLLVVLALAAIISFFIYVCIRKDTGAVSSALIAGISSFYPYSVTYGGAGSETAFRKAYFFLKSHTKVQFITEIGDSRYNPANNLVYLTDQSLLEDSAEAAHEFGHALDRYLCGEQTDYFSRQKTFSCAYAADCSGMQRTFEMQTLFETSAYRNLAISDILFAVFYEDQEATAVLTASYDASGVSYWRHEEDYWEDLENRQTEVFADLFSIFLSDDEDAKEFVKTFFPHSCEKVIFQVEKKAW